MITLPSRKMSQSFTSSTILDDTSSNITYTGTWAKMGNTATPYNLYNSTDTWSDRLGDTVTLSFYGTSVEYWGNQGNTRGPCQLTLDGNDVGIVNGYAPIEVGQPVLLWESGAVALAEHTLAIKIITDDGPNRCEVDRFVIHISINAATAPTEISSSTISSSAPASISASMVSMSSQTDASLSTSFNSIFAASSDHVSTSIPSAAAPDEVSTNTYNTSTGSTSSVLLSVIIGSVLGAIAVISLLAFLFWRHRHIRRRRCGELQPFMLVQNSGPSIRATTPDLYSTPRTRTALGMKRMEEITPISSPQTPSMDQRRTSVYSGAELLQTQMVDSGLNEYITRIVLAARLDGIRPVTADRPIATQELPPAYYEA